MNSERFREKGQKLIKIENFKNQNLKGISNQKPFLVPLNIRSALKRFLTFFRKKTSHPVYTKDNYYKKLTQSAFIQSTDHVDKF